ncbi:LuxR C-terminal-related transcriptional regulator [Streptomyces bobili]|uniref:response regulator transcription factor n=1 Tax=Streptomyces bobili TaxID=67280 RepID=UPI0033B50C4E
MVISSPSDVTRVSADPTTPELNQLSTREGQILSLVATPPDNRTLAHLLGISPPTVKSHVNRILRKLGASSGAHLVTTAYESGLVSPGLPLGRPRTRRASRSRPARPADRPCRTMLAFRYPRCT